MTVIKHLIKSGHWTPCFFLLVLFLLTPSEEPRAYTPEFDNRIPNEIAAVFQRHKIPLDSLSLYIIDLDNRRPLIAFNEDQPRNPASTIKLLTTLAGLNILGPAYTWQTEFYLDGELKENLLIGNLILRGGGDPFLSKEYLWQVLYNLQARGLRDIMGNLIIDDSLYQDEDGSPADFDNKPYHVYNIFPDAALMNFNAHEFTIYHRNNRVEIYSDPPSENLIVENQMNLKSGSCFSSGKPIIMNVHRRGDFTVASFSGDFPKYCTSRTLIRSVMPHNEYVFGVFKSMWKRLGGSITGGFINRKATISGSPFYTVNSLPLSEIIKSINKYSNNVMSRQLLLTIGQEVMGGPGSRESGVKAVQRWLENIDLEAPELLIDNGAGLSRRSRITARHLGEILAYAHNSPLSAEFLASLPIAGIDGTMRTRLNGEIASGHVRIKTGLLDHIRTMAGYIRSDNGHNYAIVALQSHHGIHRRIGTEIQDALIKWLYRR